ncbi:hypothetical protein ACFYW1_03880 [Streptomyces sp. NPDC002669]|uniref:hypothetical protein n=1 Tax=unclassified Streptomyces TaxID=2593676 RepID=UPI0036AB2AE7
MSPPIAVHGPTTSADGRAVTINGSPVGIAHNDQDLIEFLRRAGLYEAENLLDDPAWVDWQEGPAHCYSAP